ncbi:CDP-glycerol glycerophosphotransferase family protein [Gammaproteobacteria bacterium]|nr:CDP-glycerol glycerophosphotransferase family protein [Gammaproteobacteria bacterium]
MKILNKIFQIIFRLFSYLIPVKNDLILFGTNSGYYNNDSRFLMEFIYKNRDYRIYWVGDIKHSDIPEGAFVKRGGLQANILAVQASYLIFTHSQKDISLYYNAKTKLVNLWHGSPVKKLGMDSKFYLKNQTWLEKLVKRDFQTWDYFIAPSFFWKDIFKSAYCFKENQILVSGSPRTDYLQNNQAKPQLLKDLCDGADIDKVILYVPTYRDRIVSTALYDNLLSDVNLHKTLKEQKILLIFKPHPEEQEQLSLQSEYVKTLNNFDSLIEDLYLICDMVITDYSSVIFEYSYLRKPILLFIPDYEEFSKKIGGFYFDYKRDFSGFNILKNKLELISLINEDIWKVDSNFYTQFNKKYTLANASQNICKQLNI